MIESIRKYIAGGLALFLLCAQAPLFLFSAVSVKAAVNSEVIASEWIVKFVDHVRVEKIILDAPISLSEMSARLTRNGAIEYIEPNYRLSIAAFPDDPYFIQQNYLPLIHAKEAWSQEALLRELEGRNGRSVIAVLDTGVDTDHPDLQKNIWNNKNERAGNGVDDDRNGYIDDVYGWDFVNEDNDPQPELLTGATVEAVSHGTIVAGVAAAASHNAQGITGVSWYSEIMPLRVLNSDGYGEIYNVVRAIDYAVAKGADVINMSFFGVGFSNALHDAIKRAYDQGVVVVAAAGNTDPVTNGLDLSITKSYPVCYDGINHENLVIGVASINSNLKKSNFSNYGGCVDVVAPGELFFSTQFYAPMQSGFEGYYNGYWSGTSLAAPVVSGVFAALKALRPELSIADLHDAVLNTAQNIDQYNTEWRNQLGRGLVNYQAAVNAIATQKIPQSSSRLSHYIVAGLGFGSFPQLKVMNSNGTVFKEFFAYSPTFKGPVHVAAADVNGDGTQEIITGAGAGGGPHVRVFTIEGNIVSQFFAGDKRLRNGITVAAANVIGDEAAEIVTGAGKGGAPLVTVFDYKGTVLTSFLAYGENFRGGVKVTTGDIDGDGREEIITGAGAGGGPHVRIFDGEGNLIGQFFAFNQQFTSGVTVAAGDVNNDGRDEVVVSIEKNATATVKVFTYTGVELNSFIAYEPNFLEGVNVTTGDLNGDGWAEIITAKNNGQAEVKIFNAQGELQSQFNAHTSRYSGGARLDTLHH